MLFCFFVIKNHEDFFYDFGKAWKKSERKRRGLDVHGADLDNIRDEKEHSKIVCKSDRVRAGGNV